MMGGGLQQTYVSNAAQSGYTYVNVYVGDGTSPRQIATNFQPDLVEIWRRDPVGGTKQCWVAARGYADNLYGDSIGTPFPGVDSTPAVTINATGFILTIGTGVNDVGLVYWYRATKSGS